MLRSGYVAVATPVTVKRLGLALLYVGRAPCLRDTDDNIWHRARLPLLTDPSNALPVFTRPLWNHPGGRWDAVNIKSAPCFSLVIFPRHAPGSVFTKTCFGKGSTFLPRGGPD